MTYRKNIFLLIHDKNHDFLILKRKDREIWELPGFMVSNTISIKEQLEEFFTTEISANPYSIIKRSDIINRYELPKEFQSIAGVSGEEYGFMYIEIYPDATLCENSKFSEIQNIEFTKIPEMINIRNKDKIFNQLYAELKLLEKEQKEFSSRKDETYNNSKNNIFDETHIDRID